MRWILSNTSVTLFQIRSFNPSGLNLTNWSNTFKQFVGFCRRITLSVFDKFFGLAFKGLIHKKTKLPGTLQKCSKCFINSCITLLIAAPKARPVSASKKREESDKPLVDVVKSQDVMAAIAEENRKLVEYQGNESVMRFHCNR